MVKMMFAVIGTLLGLIGIAQLVMNWIILNQIDFVSLILFVAGVIIFSISYNIPSVTSKFPDD